ncbi:MAG: hypothetical protein EOO38_04885 [Cytophagaceae bacterium]|nr:MAG: hypothetical protein EOO38_04885 [Cytophagaceae bacterium]
MGHKRKNPTPSPLRMLSIFDARKRGMGLPEIAERTGHSISSIMRWTDKHGDEVAFFDLLIQSFPELHEKIGFDEHYPKGGNPIEASETDPADDDLEDDETDEKKEILEPAGDE